MILRGPWKYQKHQVDMYVDTSIPYHDVKIYTALCIGCAVGYDLVVGSGLDDCWVLKKVVPDISRYHFCKKSIAGVGNVMLWACPDPLASKYVTLDMMGRL